MLKILQADINYHESSGKSKFILRGDDYFCKYSYRSPKSDLCFRFSGSAAFKNFHCSKQLERKDFLTNPIEN